MQSTPQCVIDAVLGEVSMRLINRRGYLAEVRAAEKRLQEARKILADLDQRSATQIEWLRDHAPAALNELLSEDERIRSMST